LAFFPITGQRRVVSADLGRPENPAAIVDREPNIMREAKNRCADTHTKFLPRRVCPICGQTISAQKRPFGRTKIRPPPIFSPGASKPRCCKAVSRETPCCGTDPCCATVRRATLLVRSRALLPIRCAPTPFAQGQEKPAGEDQAQCRAFLPIKLRRTPLLYRRSKLGSSSGQLTPQGRARGSALQERVAGHSRSIRDKMISGARSFGDVSQQVIGPGFPR